MQDYHLGGVVSYLLRAQSAFYSQRLKPYNLSYGQFPFLKLLYREDGLNQETIAKRLLFNKATIARAMDKLEREGYVSRIQDKTDGRANRIFLTPKGREIEPAITQLSQEWNSILISGFTEIESLVLKELTRKIVANVMHAMELEDTTIITELMK
ncbi:MAG: MarR family winged helix-turn-helix transcriptional regulator [Methanoregula sp.]|uniref:MarR family winged helix-turn-helix transcriptional regulator n=2 Tax=Methanoregula sp. TaxID=2052170 RepID=UPI003BB01241